MEPTRPRSKITKTFSREDAEDAMEEYKNRAAMEAFVAKLFATISTTYAELQMVQFPYKGDAIQWAGTPSSTNSRRSPSSNTVI
ncbi:hypothetical protein SASPL_113377 [Salvia splendens]|uniref:DUF641 domain-containing protein n=1 Tax=Salvia splendens TaxID=180675 RepID=A0A8X8Y1T2_SALSN|nr:hypothetical protein SASPL_113377 [Salvia splendens]